MGRTPSSSSAPRSRPPAAERLGSRATAKPQECQEYPRNRKSRQPRVLDASAREGDMMSLCNDHRYWIELLREPSGELLLQEPLEGLELLAAEARYEVVSQGLLADEPDRLATCCKPLYPRTGTSVARRDPDRGVSCLGTRRHLRRRFSQGNRGPSRPGTGRTARERRHSSGRGSATACVWCRLRARRRASRRISRQTSTEPPRCASRPFRWPRFRWASGGSAPRQSPPSTAAGPYSLPKRSLTRRSPRRSART